MTTKKAGRPAGKTGSARVLDDKEFKQVLKFIEIGSHAKRNTAIIVLSFYLGLRSKELAALRIGDVFNDGSIKKVLRLLAGYTKGSKHRDVSLENKAVVKALADYINERRADDGMTFNLAAPLFRSQKGLSFSAATMVQLIGTIYKDAGFQDASSHSGRRSLITKLAYSGIDLNSIRQIAGHSNLSTTQRYVQDNPQKMADILKSI